MRPLFYRYQPHAALFGGAAAFSPADLPNLAAWYRFNQGITDAAGAVSQWNDASGNARHLLQATGAAQPAKQGDGSILFDGTSDFLVASFALVQPASVVIFGKQVSWTNSDGLCDGISPGGNFLITQGGSTPNLLTYAGAATPTNANLAINVYGMIAAVFNGASSSLQINATTATTGDVGAGNAGGFTLGAHGSPASYGNIQAREVIICSAALTAPQIAQIYAYGQAQGFV